MKCLAMLLGVCGLVLNGCAGVLDDDTPSESELAAKMRPATDGPIFLFYGSYCHTGKLKPKQTSGCPAREDRPICVSESKEMGKLSSNKGEVVVVTESVCTKGQPFGPRGDFKVWRKKGSRRRLALKMPRWAKGGGGALRNDSLAFLLGGPDDAAAVETAFTHLQKVLGPNKFDYVALDEINWKYKKEPSADARAWRDGGHLARRLVLLLERMTGTPYERRMIVYFNSYNLKFKDPSDAAKKRLESYRQVIQATSLHGRIIASEAYNLNHSQNIDGLAAMFERLVPGSNRRMITVIGVSPKYKFSNQTHAESVRTAARLIRTGECPLTRQQPGIGGYSLAHMKSLPRHLRLDQAVALQKVMMSHTWPDAGAGQADKAASTKGCDFRQASSASAEPGSEDVELVVDDEIIDEGEEDLTPEQSGALPFTLSRALCKVYESGGQPLGPAEDFQVRDVGGEPIFCIAGTQSCGSWFGLCDATTGGEVNFDIGRSFKIGGENPSHCPGDGKCYPAFTIQPGYKCAVFDYDSGVHKRTLWGTTFAFIRTNAGPTLACRAGTEPAAERCRTHFGLCRAQWAPGPGDPCPCPAPLQCVRDKCRMPCLDQACNGAGGCSPGEACVMTEINIPVCMPGQASGQPCDADTPCAGGLLCLGIGDVATGTCYATCDAVGAACSTGGTCTGGIAGSDCLYCF